MHQSTIPLQADDSLPKFQAYQQQFVAYLRDPQENGVLPTSLPQTTNVYARLLYSKIEGSLYTCFPIVCELLGAVLWRQLVQAFIREHHCQSPLYREIPDEFIEYLMNQIPQMELPEFIIDLAHFEWMELVLETARSEMADTIFPIQGDPLTIIPVLNPVLHLLHYRYPVQTIAASNTHWKNWQTRVKPYDQEPVALAGYRNMKYNIQFVKLNAVTTRLIELLQEGFYTQQQALLQLAVEMHYNNTETILSFGIELLQQLEQQQIIIGSRNEQ